MIKLGKKDSKKETKIEVMKEKKGVKTRLIVTNLMNKDEVFRILALGEATGLPVLLVGPPGTAKTGTVIDYTKAMFDFTKQEDVDHFNSEGVFLLETDEGTKASEVKGVVNLEKLVTENKYELDSHITRAETVIINEVDKASSSLRNSLLGIMNEKVLFNGKNKISCNWKLFVATCNSIPKEEENNPFWDRFAIKMTVNRLSLGDMSKYYSNKDKNFKSDIKVRIPTQDQIDAIDIPSEKLEKFLNQSYKTCSDRTLSFVPLMTKAASLVYDCSIDKALIKVCGLLVGTTAANNLSKELLSVDKRTVIDKIDLIVNMSNDQQIEAAIKELENLVGTYHQKGKLSNTDILEIKQVIETAMVNHPWYSLETEVTADEDSEI